MQIENLTITGRIPSKKNSRNVFVRGGKQFNIPSTKYKEWHKQASAQLGSRPKIAFKSVCEVQMEFYLPDNRACDLTNKAESVMDLLVDNGIIQDDKWQIIPRILLHAQGVDKENPRVCVWIKENE
jgi:Holliday junction resolvase RusA-like endonuclease